ncbi:MAG: TonB-dependent receptor, partial [bacterium]|nr:TonB-dependent receptor [bacterium]
EKIALSLDGYYTRIRDLITVEGNPAQTFRGIYVDFAERPVNKGEATAYGGTVRLDTLLKKGKLTVNGYAFYSLSDGDVDGEQLPHSAKHTVKAGVEMTYKKFSLFANLNYRSKSFHATLTDAMGNYLSNDAFTVVDMYAKYSGIIKSGKIKTAVFLKIDNVFDKKYYHVSLFGPEGFAAVPQDPVKVMGGVILEF